MEARPFAAVPGGCAPGRGHQQSTEQRKFPRTEFNRLVSQGDLTQEEVHFQRSNRDPFLEAVMAPLEQRAAAGGQLLKAKGFAQNIISTVIQQPHDRISATAGRQHDDGTTQLVRQSEGEPCSRISALTKRSGDCSWQSSRASAALPTAAVGDRPDAAAAPGRCAGWGAAPRRVRGMVPVQCRTGAGSADQRSGRWVQLSGRVVSRSLN